MFDPWKELDRETNALQLITQTPSPDLLLIVFIHGFKGGDKTFGAFPQRLQHVLSESLPNTVIETVVFPPYETKGDLTEAVARFVEWLTTLTVEKEQGVAGSAKVILCGHSMGGLLAADSLLELSRSLRDGESAALWPRIIACISFDSPYLGLQPSVLKNSVTKAADVVSTAQTIGSTVFGALAGLTAGKATERATSPTQTTQTGWSRWASPAAYAIGGAVLAGAAVGSALYNQDLGQGYQWVTDHLKFIGNLWDEKALQTRVNALIELETSHSVLFRTLYVLLPPTPPQHMSSRTFILLPKLYTPAASHFLPAKNGLAADEIKGHTGMFSAATNDGYYELGLTVARFIRESIISVRGKTQQENLCF